MKEFVRINHWSMKHVELISGCFRDSSASILDLRPPSGEDIDKLKKIYVSKNDHNHQPN